MTYEEITAIAKTIAAFEHKDDLIPWDWDTADGEVRSLYRARVLMEENLWKNPHG